MSRAPTEPVRRCAVVVIGGGVGGTGAAFAAARAGADVVLLDGGPGASSLSTGAIDGPRPREVGAFVEALTGAYVLGASGAGECSLVTTGGIVRPAAGHDAALLDVSRKGRERIGVVGCERPGWDAGALARAWGGRFEVVEATLLRRTDERAIPDATFAARHDDPERLGWLGQRLREALAVSNGPFGALVLPASLGVDRSQAAALSNAVGVPCGEAVGLPGGPSGLRFERARDRLLAGRGVHRVPARANSVERAGDGWRVTCDAGTFDAHAVVVATGGLLGGGVEYRPSDTLFATALPPHAQAPLRLTLACPLTVGVRGYPLELPGSLFGVAPEKLCWPFDTDPLLERVGALVDDESSARAGLFAAGDLVADAPRTWLEALASGLRAGTGAARRAASVAAGAASARRP
jgi:hypothetical protein